MRKFRSLTRLLIFYALSLLIMLTLYYVMMFSLLKTNNQQYSQTVFDALHYEISNNTTITDVEMLALLDKPFFEGVSYQIILMLPSGQSYVHRYTRPGEKKFTTVVFPKLAKSVTPNNSYQLTNNTLTGVIKLRGGHQIYMVLRHKPVDINWLAYQYWLPLVLAMILFTVVLVYTLKRRLDWLRLLNYIESMATTSKDIYTLPPFAQTSSSEEFIRLGHGLGRINYHLHTNYRRIKTLSHRLERLVDQAPLPMLMVMRQGQISFFNQRFEQVFNTIFQRDNDYNLTDFVTGIDTTTQQLLQKLSLQRVTRTLLVYGLENKQTYQLHITPWFGEHGQVHGFTVLVNNVDAFTKQLDSEKLKNQQLQLQVKEFAQLRSVIGHELRTPLSAIIGTLDIVEESAFSLKQQDILHTLKQSSHSMLAMLNDMLDVAKIEAGKTSIANDATDIFKINQHVVDLMAGSAYKKNIDLLYLFMPECPRFIDTDAKRLQQIILNLMNNAIKFTDSGYVALIVEPVTQQKTTQNRTKGLAKHPPTQNNSSAATDQYHWIRFSVIDTGIGITEDEKHSLFSYFNQANAQISHKFGGTGLGLAISNSFAQLLGGFIQLDSDGRSGSTFALYLPCRAPTYHPTYHFHANLIPIYLIAIIKHDLYIDYLRRLCHHLSISADIYSINEMPPIAEITEKLQYKSKTSAPLLLLDYDNQPISIANSVAVATGADIGIDNHTASTMPQSNLEGLLAMPLPKILLSMKMVRNISSTYLDQFDGFLHKPLDITLLLSEIIRLTQPKLLANSSPLPLPLPMPASESIKPKAFAQPNPQAPTVIGIHSDSQQFTKQSIEALILVVEDNIINQKVACKLLDQLGYQTIVAENGKQALEQLAATEQRIVLILMDCRMPVMDGMEATRTIRAQDNDIPIVALTANDSVEDREACNKAGMNEFLTKPINKQQLFEVLQRLINV